MSFQRDPNHDHDCQVFAAKHYALPFGAVSSVYAWEKVGSLLCQLARKYLNLAIFRYVDDFFGPERYASWVHTKILNTDICDFATAVKQRNMLQNALRA